MEFQLTCHDLPVQHFSYYTTRTLLSCSRKIRRVSIYLNYFVITSSMRVIIDFTSIDFDIIKVGQLLRFTLAKQTTTRNIYKNRYLFFWWTLVWSRSNQERYLNRSSEARTLRCKLDDGWESAHGVTTGQACVNSGISLLSVQNCRPYITIKLPCENMDTPLCSHNAIFALFSE